MSLIPNAVAEALSCRFVPANNIADGSTEPNVRIIKTEYTVSSVSDLKLGG
jgi:hypothetical protein